MSLNNNLGYTMIELLVALMITGILTTMGIRSIIQYGQSQSVMGESFVVKNKLKGFQNSAINMRLTANEGCTDALCSSENWLYGVEASISDRSISSKRVFKKVNVGAPSTADLIQNRESSVFPEDRYNPGTSVAGSYAYVDMDLHDITDEDVVLQTSTYNGPGGGTLQSSKICKYVFFQSVTGLVSMIQAQDGSNSFNGGSLDKCIVYIRNTKNDNYSRGYIFTKGRATIEQCGSFASCLSTINI